MLAIVRYQFAILGHSQRYLAPVLLYVALLATQYTEPLAPLRPEYAVSAGAMTVLACWLTITAVAVENPVQRLISMSHGRRPAAMVAGVIICVGLCCAVLTIGSLSWSLLIHSSGPTTDLVDGALAHLAAIVTGISIGFVSSALVFDRVGWTLICATAGLLLVILVRWIPVINPALRALSGIGNPGSGPAVASLVTGTILLVLSSFGVGWFVRCRS